MKSIKLITAFLLSIFLLSCDSREISQNANDSSYERVIDSGILKVAYISYPPSFSHNPQNNELSGIFYDVLSEIGKNMELEIEYTEETSWGTMIESVNSGRADLIAAGIWPNGTRGKFADFTTPIYFSPIFAYVRADDSRFDSGFDLINDATTTIATIDAEMTSIIAKADFPMAAISSLPQSTDVSQVLLEVATGKADVTFVETAVAERFISKNPGEIKKIPNAAPVRVFPNVMLMRKGEYKLKTALDTAINELIYTGRVDYIISRHEVYKGSLLRKQIPYLIE